MKKWSITYYSEKVFQSIQKLPKLLKARYIALTDKMEDVGPNLGMPHTKAMGDGLFEIRIKAGTNIARIFYCIQVKKEIVVLHSFIKKTQKTPPKELKTAMTRLREVINE